MRPGSGEAGGVGRGRRRGIAHRALEPLVFGILLLHPEALTAPSGGYAARLARSPDVPFRCMVDDWKWMLRGDPSTRPLLR